MPIGIITGSHLSFAVEFLAIVGLSLWLASEIIAYLPIRENNVLQAILAAGRKAFPKPEVPESFKDGAE